MRGIARRVGIYVADLLREVWLRECAETQGFTLESQDAINYRLHAVSWWLYKHIDGNYVRDEQEQEDM